MKRISAFIPEILSPNIKTLLLISNNWKDIVGENNNKICHPYKLINKTLTVAVFDNIYIHGLTFIKEDILLCLNDKGFEIKTIKFLYKPNKVSITHNSKEFKKISEKEMQIINSLVSEIKDEKLKTSFEKALKSYFKVYGLKEFLNIE